MRFQKWSFNWLPDGIIRNVTIPRITSQNSLQSSGLKRNVCHSKAQYFAIVTDKNTARAVLFLLYYIFLLRQKIMELLLLPPAYVVCGKVIFSHMFFCQSVQLEGVLCDLPIMHWGSSVLKELYQVRPISWCLDSKEVRLSGSWEGHMGSPIEGTYVSWCLESNIKCIFGYGLGTPPKKGQMSVGIWRATSTVF